MAAHSSKHYALEEIQQYEIHQQRLKERLQDFLDSMHYEGFSAELSTDDFNFYLEQYKDCI